MRAVASVSGNLAEGNGTIFPKKEVSFYDNAKCSLDEVRSWLELAIRLCNIDERKFVELDNEAAEISCVSLFRLIHSHSNLF
ncbi:four helix bundle protein [Bacillus sp. FSL W8-0116]|uniref:four helix bundle protein n=1 Tax=Bacillus sp. FSL W8-0116 TaxID=2978206 RepID=UPI004046EF81